MQSDNSTYQQRGRRSFLQGGTLLLAAAATADPRQLFAAEPQASLRVGMVMDLHYYADKPPAGTRHYRETPRKLTEAAGNLRSTRRSSWLCRMR